MKRIASIWIVVMILAGLTALAGQAQTASAANTQPDGQPSAQSSAPDQPLGDYARGVRKDKKPDTVKKFDNDNLPTTDKLSVVGNAPAEPSDAQTDAPTDAQNADPNQKPDKDAAKAAPSAADQQKAVDEWKGKIASQKDKIDLLSRELDVLQREYKLRAAAMYADAGNRLRNEGSWDKEDAQYKQQIADKQKDVDSAKQQMDDMQEQARKAGVPSSARE